MTHNQHSIHPTAIVSNEAEIGKNVTIGAYAIVEGNSVIGDDTFIHPHAIIRSGARIGKHCQIHPFSVIAGIPQDLKFHGEDTLAIIGDNTIIREYATINRGTASKGKTVIGKDCLIMSYSHIAHDCLLKDHIIIGNLTQLAGEVEVDEYANVSGGTLVHQFVRISKHVMVQGGSKISQDIPPYILVGRDPLIYCGLNVVGLRRRHFTSEQINTINEAYRILYLQGLNTSNAIATIQSSCAQTPEIESITSFIQESQRGIVKGSMA